MLITTDHCWFLTRDALNHTSLRDQRQARGAASSSRRGKNMSPNSTQNNVDAPIAHSIIGCQTQLASIDKRDGLLRCAIDYKDGNVVYNRTFGRRFGDDLSPALKRYHAELQARIGELK